LAKNGRLSNLPQGWSAYDWGRGPETISIRRVAGAGREGRNAVLLQNKTAAARAMLYTHMPLPDAEYEFSVWAKAAPGETAKVKLYFANVYSSEFTVTDRWQKLQMVNSSVTVDEAVS